MQAMQRDIVADVTMNICTVLNSARSASSGYTEVVTMRVTGSELCTVVEVS